VLRLVERSDPLTELVARKIIEVAQTGLKDPVKISAQALKELGIPKPDEQPSKVDRRGGGAAAGHESGGRAVSAIARKLQRTEVAVSLRISQLRKRDCRQELRKIQ